MTITDPEKWTARARLELAGRGVLAALAFTELPKTALGRVPTPIIAIIGIALLAWALTRRGATKPLAAPADNAEWLTQLRTLLVGRHHIAHVRATELTAEAAAHLAETGAPPLDEFGPADEYAVTLAEQEPRR